MGIHVNITLCLVGPDFGNGSINKSVDDAYQYAWCTDTNLLHLSECRSWQAQLVSIRFQLVSDDQVRYSEKWTAIVGPLQQTTARQNPIPVLKLFLDYSKAAKQATVTITHCKPLRFAAVAVDDTPTRGEGSRHPSQQLSWRPSQKLVETAPKRTRKCTWSYK
ncbi:hypothetical protein HAX54_013346 [Datura stramonium]|uniref:Uncharacterized protein n=1 Tax=Datura stramonium TaxID=4076 RepID=A0ABS8TP06_DATST|nr:hypothetical protein [Datura stramonium]